MQPHWLAIAAIASLTVSILCALAIASDLAWGRRQKMAVMNAVWPVTALYFGPVALLAYWTLGRERPKTGGPKPEKPFWQSAFVAVTHCGAGCTLGDFAGEWAVYLLGFTILGSSLWPAFIADFALAYLLGIVFQYFSIVPMRHLKPLPGVWAAIEADTLSIVAFEIGMFLWMAFARFVLFQKHPLHPVQPVYWFSMQIAMILGFCTSYPMNWWLLRRGLKEKM